MAWTPPPRRPWRSPTPQRVPRGASRSAARASTAKACSRCREIAEGETIIEYMGEVINWKEALRRHPHDPTDPNHTFYFHIDENRVIDAKVGGNSARWINHSCDPNCEADEEDGRVFIKALRNIKAGRRAQLRLRPDHRRALHQEAQGRVSPAGAAPSCAAARCWRPSAGSGSKKSKAELKPMALGGSADMAAPGRGEFAAPGAVAAGLHGRGRCPRSTPATAN